jgi:hypothetical protein
MGEADPITRPSLYEIAHGRRFAPAESGVVEASRPPIGKFQAGRHRAARSWAHSSIGLFSRCRYRPGLWRRRAPAKWRRRASRPTLSSRHLARHPAGGHPRAALRRMTCPWRTSCRACCVPTWQCWPCLTPSSGSSVSRVLPGLRRPVDVHDAVHHDHGRDYQSVRVHGRYIRQNLQPMRRKSRCTTAASAVLPARRDRNGGSVTDSAFTMPLQSDCQENARTGSVSV